LILVPGILDVNPLLSVAVMRFFGTHNRLPISFLAVNDVIPGLGCHQNPDAALGGLRRFGGGSPNQMTVACYAKDVEGRKHGVRVIP
jgi:hypothetical protein